MDLLLRSRGPRITEQQRATVEHKVLKLSRLDPRADRLEIEVLSERNPRLNGTKRLEGALVLPRRTLRATASAPDLESALDMLVERLERLPLGGRIAAPMPSFSLRHGITTVIR